MDAKRMRGMFCAGLLLVTGGCYLTQTAPTIQRTQPEPATKVDAEVVDAAPGAPDNTGDVELASQQEVVQAYIQRIDDIERRVHLAAEAERSRRDDTPPLATTEPPADAQPVPPAPEPTDESEAPINDQPVPSAPADEHSSPQIGPPTPAAGEQPTTTEAAGQDDPPLEPPILASVSVHAQPTIAPPPATDELAGPVRANTAAVARQAPISLEQFLSLWPPNPDHTSFRQQLDLRVLRVVAGDYEGAREPLSMVSDEQQEIAQRFVESLVEIRQAHDGDPAAATTRVLQELERLEQSLRPLSELRIPTLAICQEVLGYGQYRLIDPPNFPAGVASEFVAYCELRDFVSEERDDGLYHACFEMRTCILNRSGETVLEINDSDIVDRCRQPRYDCFIPRLVRLPATLSPGEYVVKVTVTDKLGEKMAENRATFRIVAGR